MGNVQHKGKADGLTKFQREKLKHEFYTFFGKLSLQPAFLSSNTSSPPSSFSTSFNRFLGGSSVGPISFRYIGLTLPAAFSTSFCACANSPLLLHVFPFLLLSYYTCCSTSTTYYTYLPKLLSVRFHCDSGCPREI